MSRLFNILFGIVEPEKNKFINSIMQPKPILLTPTIAQIEQLRADFFKRLEAEGAPCEGMFEQSIVFFKFFPREFS